MRAEGQAASCQRALNFCITPAIVIYWPRVCLHRGRKSCTTKLSLQIVTRKSQLLFVPIWSRAYCDRAIPLSACYYYFRDCCARLLRMLTLMAQNYLAALEFLYFTANSRQHKTFEMSQECTISSN
jgi:hypothetical protein